MTPSGNGLPTGRGPILFRTTIILFESGKVTAQPWGVPTGKGYAAYAPYDYVRIVRTTAISISRILKKIWYSLFRL